MGEADKKVSKKEFECEAALVCGEAFQRLAEGFIPRIHAIKEKSSPHMSNELGDLVACATNLGFAIELYLKALLMQLNIPVPRVHDLRALYDKIHGLVKEVLESVYDTAMIEDVRRLRGRVSFTLAKGQPKRPRRDEYKVSLDLPDLLARSRDIFESWRYIFE